MYMYIYIPLERSWLKLVGKLIVFTSAFSIFLILHYSFYIYNINIYYININIYIYLFIYMYIYKQMARYSQGYCQSANGFIRAGDTGVGGRGACPAQPLLLRSKKKKGKPGKKRTIFKAETIERLSPRSKYYCFSHSRVSRIRNFFLSVNHCGRQ